MYCPRCAVHTTDETNFCNKCGLSLRAVADALHSRPTTEQFDWSKTWLVEMLMTDDERMRRRAAAEIAAGPEGATLAEMKSARDVKNGIITSFAGIGSAIFLWVFLGALADVVEAGSPAWAVVLRHVWAAGVIPFVVGLGIIASALFVDTNALRRGRAATGSLQSRLAGGARREGRTTSELPALDAPPSTAPSVTEHTTELLTEPAVGQSSASGGRLMQK